MVPVAVPVMSPTHLLRLEVFHLVPGDDRRFGACAGRGRQTRLRRDRGQRCGLCAGAKRHGAGGEPNGEFQKVTALHDISSFVVSDGEILSESR
jgi:hypothetical protein